MFESLTGLMQKAWWPGRDDSRFSGPSGDAPQGDSLYRRTVRNPSGADDPTAPIRVPLNWLPAPEPESPTDGKVRATR